jgi:hypothetical protein
MLFAARLLRNLGRAATTAVLASYHLPTGAHEHARAFISGPGDIYKTIWAIVVSGSSTSQ